MSKIILSADSTCDLSPELIERYNVKVIPFHIIIGDKDYQDKIDITPEDIFHTYWQTKVLPHTTAINVQEYTDHFQPWLNEGYEIIHINLSSAISSSHQNCRLAAESLGGVYAIDSRNLSTGSGLLVIRAAEMIAEGTLSAAQIAQKLETLTRTSYASFVLDSLEFMHAGGRCSSLAALGANLLSLKPSIRMNNETGTMQVHKKYRGSFESCVLKYVREQLAAYPNIDTRRIFITHTCEDEKIPNAVKKLLLETMPFEEVLETRAGCTISSHCGPNCLGILFMTKE